MIYNDVHCFQIRRSGWPELLIFLLKAPNASTDLPCPHFCSPTWQACFITSVEWMNSNHVGKSYNQGLHCMAILELRNYSLSASASAGQYHKVTIHDRQYTTFFAVTHHPYYLDPQGSWDRFLDNAQHILYLPDVRAASGEDWRPGVLAVSGEKGSILIKVVSQERINQLFVLIIPSPTHKTRGLWNWLWEILLSVKWLGLRCLQGPQCGS